MKLLGEGAVLPLEDNKQITGSSEMKGCCSQPTMFCLFENLAILFLFFYRHFCTYIYLFTYNTDALLVILREVRFQLTSN